MTPAFRQQLWVIVRRTFFVLRMAFYAFVVFRAIQAWMAGYPQVALIMVGFFGFIELCIQGVKGLLWLNRRNAALRLANQAQAELASQAQQRIWDTE